jgi:gamma-glutamyltranspeptidase/glutathione hydrolase
MMCGIGGFGVMQIFDLVRPATSSSMAFHVSMGATARWVARFERECSDGYGYVLTGAVNELGHAAVTTPGILRLFADAHGRFGRLAWSGLIEPAIAIATEGWLIRPHVAGVFMTDERAYGRMPYSAKLAATPDGRALYMRPDGTPKRVGDPVRNQDLARTLGEIARQGVDGFYEGKIARSIVADMQPWRLLPAADLAFRTRVHAP